MASHRKPSWVYKLHFVPPYKHAAHYSGRTGEPAHRFVDHALGRGARLTEVQVEAGGSWVVGLLEPGGAERERQIKGHDAARYCNVCQAEKALQAGEVDMTEALTRAGWDRATPYEKGLLLEVFGLDAAPESLVPVSTPATVEIPEPKAIELHYPEPTAITPEIDAVVDALCAGWAQEAKARLEPDVVTSPEVSAPRQVLEPQALKAVTAEPEPDIETSLDVPPPRPALELRAQAEIAPEADAQMASWTQEAEAEPELELEIG